MWVQKPFFTYLYVRENEIFDKKNLYSVIRYDQNILKLDIKITLNHILKLN